MNYAIINEYVKVSNVAYRSAAWVLFLPLALMALDTVTGLVKSWVTTSFQSSKMRTGLGKKVGEMVILIVGELLQYALGLPTVIMTGISLYIVFMEIMSIVENLNTLNVPLPAFVTKVLHNVDESLKEEDISAVIDALEDKK